MMKRSGFTLVELLVVVAIVGMLIAILSPSLWAARRQTHEVICRHNLHQIDLALKAYTTEHKGWYPLADFECNPHPKLLDGIQAHRRGLMEAMYCTQAKIMEPVAQNTTDYPPKDVSTSVLDTPENRKVGNIGYLYWSHKDRSIWRARGKWTGNMDSFRPRHLRDGLAPLPFTPTVDGAGEEPDTVTPCEVLPAVPAQRWVLSDFFRQGAPFPHVRKHKSGLNVSYLDGHAGWMYGQPRANFR